MKLPTSIHAEPDEIEQHARDIERMCDWLAELVPDAGAVRLRGPHESRLPWSEQPGEDLPGWHELSGALAAHETATARSQRLLLDRLHDMAGDLHRVAVELREVEAGAGRMWERLS